MEYQNAIIHSADILIDDHGLLTCWLDLRYGGSGQGFGGYALDNITGARFIRRILDTVGVTKWRDLAGKAIRVQNDLGKVYAIGHIVENRWFAPGDELRDKE